MAARTSNRFNDVADLDRLAKARRSTTQVVELTDGQTPGLRARLSRGRDSTGVAFVVAYVGDDGKRHRVPVSPAGPDGRAVIYVTGAPTAARRDALAAIRGEASRMLAEARAPDVVDPHVRIARETAAQAELEREQRAQGQRDGWTVARLAEAYLETLEASGRRAKTIGEYRRQFEAYINPVVGDMPADAVRPVNVEQVTEPLIDVPRGVRAKTRQANAVVTALGGMYSWASRARRLRGPSPPAHLRGIASPTVSVAHHDVDPVRKRRALTDAETGALWRELSQRRGDVYSDALALVLLCGTRAGETVHARWQDIDLDGEVPCWTVPAEATKSGREHRVLLSPQAVELLRSRLPKGRARGYVFPVKAAKDGHARIDTVADRLREVCAALGFEHHVVPHELRHTAITAVRGVLGYGEDVRRRVANHASPDRLEQVYVHATWDDEARDAWRRWRALVESLAGEEDGAEVVRLPRRSA